MQYQQKSPKEKLLKYIKLFWQIDGSDNIQIKKDKIIPDGFPEIIFHYKDLYKININNKWEVQSKFLIAGQIKNHFYLENTGIIGMLGIKLQPSALKILFDLDMVQLVDNVIQIPKDLESTLKSIISIATSNQPFETKIEIIENWFENYIKTHQLKPHEIDKAVNLIISRKGNLNVKDICSFINVNERTLERYFKSYIGLTPKFYCRIIRFSNIFKTINETNNWLDISYISGFYDQSHFIKNFKEFTGEDPSKYGFDKENMANFFLK
ncbi:helix-turn-helix domain-containing protein [Flavobacteriaceae bacterium AU392]|nr:AraC family transcriptional regulator [Flavobacteriaceae bacterium]RKM85874.1 helix-turn-helix domain-containing protein [Flavobacteriaceae bacterium AU392]